MSLLNHPEKPKPKPASSSLRFPIPEPRDTVAEDSEVLR